MVGANVLIYAQGDINMVRYLPSIPKWVAGRHMKREGRNYPAKFPVIFMLLTYKGERHNIPRSTAKSLVQYIFF